MTLDDIRSLYLEDRDAQIIAYRLEPQDATNGWMSCSLRNLPGRAPGSHQPGTGVAADPLPAAPVPVLSRWSADR